MQTPRKEQGKELKRPNVIECSLDSQEGGSEVKRIKRQCGSVCVGEIG